MPIAMEALDVLCSFAFLLEKKKRGLFDIFPMFSGLAHFIPTSIRNFHHIDNAEETLMGRISSVCMQIIPLGTICLEFLFLKLCSEERSTAILKEILKGK